MYSCWVKAFNKEWKHFKDFESDLMESWVEFVKLLLILWDIIF